MHRVARRASFAIGAVIMSASVGAAPEPRDTLVEVFINGEPQEDWSLVRISDDDVVRVTREQLAKWGLTLPAEALLAAVDTEPYLRVGALPGIQAHVDSNGSRLELTVQPGLMTAHRLGARLQVDSSPEPSAPGGLLNYAANLTHSNGANDAAGLLEAGVFSGPLILSSTWFATSLLSGAGATRLDTSMVVDFPASRTSLAIGDTVASAELDGNQVRVGGFSWGTDFSTAPSFITFPLPSVRGEAVIPTTIDLIINGARSQHVDVPAGPFTLDNIPVPSGSGELTFTVRDLLGREQVVRERYYATPALLRRGLTSWGVQAGAKRDDYGLESSAYAGWIAAASLHRGVTDHLTGGLQLTGGDQFATLGGSLALGTYRLGLWSSGLTCGHTNGDNGCRIRAGMQKELRGLGFGFDVFQSTAGYSPVAESSLIETPRGRIAGHVATSVPRFGSLAFFATYDDRGAHPNALRFSLTASRTLGDFGFINLILVRTQSSPDSSLVALGFTRRLKHGRTAGAQMQTQDKQRQATVSLERNVPMDRGYGYRLGVNALDPGDFRADGTWNGARHSTTALVESAGGDTALQAGTSGAVVWFGGEPIRSRWLENGFAVARVGSLSGVPIFHDGRAAGRTDASGMALVSGLRPFERNVISVDPVSLPITMDAPTTAITATPFRRGGVLVNIPIDLSGTLRLMQNNGKPVPVGAIVQTRRGIAPVGMNGMAFVHGKGGRNAFAVEWDGGQCHIDVELPTPVGDETEVACTP